MNEAHLALCSSPEWARMVEEELHHIPTVAQQDRALAELARVVRSGGVLVGSDGLDTPERREVHAGDIFVPLDAATLPGRLRSAGFVSADVEVAGDRIRFAATAP